ncbi:MAG: DUF4476 domain-containing protein [Bacteroidales bacterium]|jgi:hypothetical protein|nr:DUF4476 domain-containing protein [Bacteroidales bacterium]
MQKTIIICFFSLLSVLSFSQNSQKSGSFGFSLGDNNNQRTGTLILEGFQNFQMDLSQEINIMNLFPGKYFLTIYYKNNFGKGHETKINQDVYIESGKVSIFTLKSAGYLESKTLLDPNSIELCMNSQNVNVNFNIGHDDHRHNDRRNNDHNSNTIVVEQTPIIVEQPHFVQEMEFSKLMNSLRNESFENDRVLALKTSADFYPYFSSEQVRQLASLFSFDDNKLEIVKYLVPKVFDYSGLPLLKDVFTYSSTKNNYLNFLNSLTKW